MDTSNTKTSRQMSGRRWASVDPTRSAVALRPYYQCETTANISEMHPMSIMSWETI